MNPWGGPGWERGRAESVLVCQRSGYCRRDVPGLSRPLASSRGHGEHGRPFAASLRAGHPVPRCGGLAFFSCVGADANVTAGHGTEGLTCGAAENCTGNVTQLRRQGHFSRCPEEYKHYCVKGRCRFLVAEKAPACVCERGYTGARCERVDIFYLRGDRGQIVIISLIAAIVSLIILIVCACLCSHHCRKQRRKRKAEEMETLNKNSPSKSEDVLETGIA
ncbi:probetacellulin isoform X1 [Aquila chrysaetos chrysaetos]|uniref:probetacellulin isoform X1 n=1 Tax=Aquila chrysaetos chrysaetos TaxID=223781 RepID=UPI00117710EA|nr:probetacellulin isoform X1 [Aquila chrysaetos chrysaetos]